MHFPLKLYQLVQAGPPEVIAWSDNGKSFLVVDADIFCNKILPKHFRHNKLTSFQRQLNLYGFQRIAKGTEAGRYYHALFDKNRPDRLSSIKRESRTGMANGEVDEQPLPLTDEDGECSNTTEAPAPVSNSSRSRTRSSRTSLKEKSVVAGPEDHTAALAMINISRSLSSECLEAQGSLSTNKNSPASTPSSNSIFTKLHETEFETILKKSLERQTALEAEVVQLKSLVNTMMAKMETLCRSSIETNPLNTALETLSDTASSVSSNQSDDDEEKRRYESEEEDFSQNKRLKREDSPTPLPLIQTLPPSPVDSPGMSYDE